MEDKWYNVLDSIDQKIPVYPIVDRIDNIVPSFALFLVLVLVVLVLIAGVLLLGDTQAPGVQATVIVTAQGLPVANADITLSAECFRGLEFQESASEFGISDSDGKSLINICKDSQYEVVVKRTGYEPYTQIVSPGSDTKILVSLTPVTISLGPKLFFAEVVDDTGKQINTAVVEMVCTDTLERRILPKSTSNTYEFELVEGCSTIQLISTAQGFERKTLTINQNLERATITMTKTEGNGTVEFSVSTDQGVEEAEVVIVDRFQKTDTLFTTGGVALFEEVTPNTYTYTVRSQTSGKTKQGIFTLTPKEDKVIDIVLESATQAQIDNTKRIHLKIVDDVLNPVIGAQTKIFIDGNLLTSSRTSNAQGIIQLVVPDETANYEIVVKKIGYQIRNVVAQLKLKDEAPQSVILKQGGGELTVKVIDELEDNVIGVQTTLFLDGFSAYIDSASTDSNGEVLYKDLPTGNYKVVAQKEDSEGTLDNISLSEDDQKSVVLQMIIGKGKIGYNLYDQAGKKVNVTDYIVDAKLTDSYTQVSEGITTRFYFESSELKHGTMVRAIINDENFFEYEGIPYSVYRGKSAQKKEIYLRANNPLTNKMTHQSLNLFCILNLYLRPTRRYKLILLPLGHLCQHQLLQSLELLLALLPPLVLHLLALHQSH